MFAALPGAKPVAVPECWKQQQRPARTCKDVSTASSAAANPVPAAPQNLFAKKIGALALIFLGGTINYTILQVRSVRPNKRRVCLVLITSINAVQ